MATSDPGSAPRRCRYSATNEQGKDGGGGDGGSGRDGGDGDCRRLAYAEYGDPDGDPVLFLHGTPGSRRLGALFDADARERGVRLLAPDRPGFGRSAPWPTRSVSDAGTFLTAVLDDAGVGAAPVVAFSGGAAQALATAATDPGRVSRVDCVAGATPPEVAERTPPVQRALAWAATTAPAVLRALLRGQSWLAARRDPSFVVGQYTASDRDAPVPDDAASAVKTDFLEALAESRSGTVTELRNAASEWGIALDEIGVDVRLWHGDADTNVPVDGVRRLASTLPAAELHVVDGADHLGTLLSATPDVLDGVGEHRLD
ncbi:alpha/beta fold hydrolase [Halobaculum sp. P14]|uniref:alpha/beta fold hydrolase n=1 Tax=Halobaculum sp. P14 TaxID=3421638 RepID=UPI003EBF3770